jgi:2-dehydropantoate 2-reductase
MGRRYVVVGCGAVGGLYGARLAAAGHDVAFVARSDVEVLRRDGLRLDSVDGDVVLPPASFGVAASASQLAPPDVVILAVKTTSTVDVRPLVGPGTTLAVFQNGLGVEAAADAAAPGAAAVVGGMCFVCSAKAGPGHVRHADYGPVTLATHRGPAEAAEHLAADLRGAGVEATVAAHLATARWRKLLWNIPFNGLTAVLGTGTDELLASPSGRELVVALMGEVVAGARACGADLGPSDIDDMVNLTEKMVPYRASMALDLEAGRPLEHRAIYGEPVRAAAAAGAAMPRVEALWQVLDVLDQRNQARSTAR